jgi:hypothetical protein
MTTTLDHPEQLGPNDPPILLAGLIAARRSGDKLLATVLKRELEAQHGITVRFLAEHSSKGARNAE